MTLLPLFRAPTKGLGLVTVQAPITRGGRTVIGDGLGEGVIPGDEEGNGEGLILGGEEGEDAGGPSGETSFSGTTLQVSTFSPLTSETQGPSPISMGTPRSALEKKICLFLAKKIPTGIAKTSTKSIIKLVKFFLFWK